MVETQEIVFVSEHQKARQDFESTLAQHGKFTQWRRGTQEHPDHLVIQESQAMFGNVISLETRILDSEEIKERVNTHINYAVWPTYPEIGKTFDRMNVFTAALHENLKNADKLFAEPLNVVDVFQEQCLDRYGNKLKPHFRGISIPVYTYQKTLPSITIRGSFIDSEGRGSPLYAQEYSPQVNFRVAFLPHHYALAHLILDQYRGRDETKLPAWAWEFPHSHQKAGEYIQDEFKRVSDGIKSIAPTRLSSSGRKIYTQLAQLESYANRIMHTPRGETSPRIFLPHAAQLVPELGELDEQLASVKEYVHSGWKPHVAGLRRFVFDRMHDYQPNNPNTRLIQASLGLTPVEE